MDIMKASQVAQTVAEDGFSFGLTPDHKVVTHSRGTSWVLQSPTGAYLTVTLTEGGNHIQAVTGSNFGGQKAKKATDEELFCWFVGSIRIGRNSFKAYKSMADGSIERINKDGERVAYTGTARFIEA